MKAIRTFVILILTAFALALLPILSGATGGSASTQEINIRSEALSSSTRPVTAPEPANEDNFIQILQDIVELLSDIADICMEVLFTLWSGASESARCFLGLLITLNVFFSLYGLRSALFRDVNRGRHIYME